MRPTRLRAGEVREELQAERRGVAGCICQRGSQPEPFVGHCDGEHHHHHGNSTEEHPESDHACGGEVTRPALQARQHQAEQLRAEPEHRADRPAADAPAGEQEDRQRDGDARSPRRLRAAGQAVLGAVRSGGIRCSGTDHGRGDADGDADDGAEREPVTRFSDRPADHRAEEDARCRGSDEHAAGPCEGERRSLGLHRCGAYQRL